MKPKAFSKAMKVPGYVEGGFIDNLFELKNFITRELHFYKKKIDRGN